MGYDALKGVDPALTVVGVGLSPRGNDRPTAKSNVSTSPVRFLAALGAWYRASGRQRPLMDGLSFHPYPNVATDPLSRGYAWPNAGFVNLDRLKQAVWDAFAGTEQPTTVDGLRLYLDEVGWQVDTTGRDGYVGTENVPVTREETQAAIYGELVRRAACDQDIAQVNVFGFRDDALRTGFQAGLYRVDGSARPAAAGVHKRRGTRVTAGPLVEQLDPRGQRARDGSAGEVLGGALLTLGAQLLRGDQLLSRQVELLGRGAHAVGDLLDALTRVALDVVEQLAGEALDLVRRTLGALFPRRSATASNACHCHGPTATAATGRGTCTRQRDADGFHRGFANQLSKLFRELFDASSDTIIKGVSHGEAVVHGETECQCSGVSGRSIVTSKGCMLETSTLFSGPFVTLIVLIAT